MCVCVWGGGVVGRWYLGVPELIRHGMLKFDNWNLINNCDTRKNYQCHKEHTMRCLSRVFAFISAFVKVHNRFFFLLLQNGLASNPILIRPLNTVVVIIFIMIVISDANTEEESKHLRLKRLL